MKDVKELREDCRALNNASEKARMELYTKSLRLSDFIVKNRDNIRSINEDALAKHIRAFVEADEQYGKAVLEATAASERLVRVLYAPRQSVWRPDQV